MTEKTVLPNWAWGGVSFLLAALSGGLGTWAGYTLFDHERRLVKVEADQFTETDARLLVKEMRIDLKDDLTSIRQDVSAMRTDFSGLRRDFDRSGISKAP